MENTEEKKYYFRNRSRSWLVCLLFIFGMFVPTSINSVIDRNLTMVITIIIFLFLGILLFLCKKIQIRFLISFLLINLLVWTATLLNQQPLFMKTPAMLFLLVSSLFCIDLKTIYGNRVIPIFFKIVNIIVIVIGFAMIFHIQSIDDLFIKIYSDFYPELVPNMLDRGKPVITFGTHSVAAFYLFLFFFLNIRTYSLTNSKISFVFAVIYLCFCVNLNSNTGYIYVLIGVFILLKYLKHRFVWLSLLVIGTFFYVSYNQEKVSLMVQEAQYQMTETLSSNANGVMGRYSNDGNQTKNINYILDHPFSPTGFSTSQDADVVYFDSGLIVTALQGTVLLTIIVYGSLFLFLKSNIINKKISIFMFLFFMIFEIGFNNLFYFRTLCILPFFILYLNYIEQRNHSKNNKVVVPFEQPLLA